MRSDTRAKSTEMAFIQAGAVLAGLYGLMWVIENQWIIWTVVALAIVCGFVYGLMEWWL